WFCFRRTWVEVQVPPLPARPLNSLDRSMDFEFFFDDSAPTEIYTLSLHDALPISWRGGTNGTAEKGFSAMEIGTQMVAATNLHRDRKSTRLNSSHVATSYAVFCLEKQGVRDLVDAWTTQDDVDAMKPDLDLVQAAI